MHRNAFHQPDSIHYITSADPALPGLAATDPPPNIVRGSADDDVLQGTEGVDIIDAGGGNDYLYDDRGHNLLLGGDGNDAMIGRGTFQGGPGHDDIVAAGDARGNVYLFNLGDGHDTIAAAGDMPAIDGNGTLVFGADIQADDVKLVRDGDDMIFYVDLFNQVKVFDWFKDERYQLRQVSFDDGLLWPGGDITRMSMHILGTDDNDVLYGGKHDDLIHGGGGNDYLMDPHGENMLNGGDGNDVLIGRGMLEGGPGDDILHALGDARTSLYFYDEGDGRDRLYAYSNENRGADGQPPGPQGTIGFGESLTSSRLWLRRAGDDLQVLVAGSQDGIIINDWYLGAQHQVALLFAGDDKLLANSRVDALVEAMAHYDAPSSAQAAALPPPPDLQMALAAAWK